MFNEIFSKGNIIFIIISLIILFIPFILKVFGKMFLFFFKNIRLNISRINIKVLDYTIRYYHKDNFKPPFPENMPFVTKYDNPDGLLSSFDLEISNTKKENIEINILNVYIKVQENKIKPIKDVLRIKIDNQLINNKISLKSNDSLLIKCEAEFDISNAFSIKKNMKIYITYKIKNKTKKRKIHTLNEKNKETPKCPTNQ